MLTQSQCRYPHPPTHTRTHAQVHTPTECHTILTNCDSILVFAPQFFMCDEDSNGATVVKNNLGTPARQLVIVPESALHKSGASTEDATTTE